MNCTERALLWGTLPGHGSVPAGWNTLTAVSSDDHRTSLRGWPRCRPVRLSDRGVSASRLRVQAFLPPALEVSQARKTTSTGIYRVTLVPDTGEITRRKADKASPHVSGRRSDLEDDLGLPAFHFAVRAGGEKAPFHGYHQCQFLL